MADGDDNRIFMIQEMCEDCGECGKVLAVTMTATTAYAARNDYQKLHPSNVFEVVEVVAKPGSWRPEIWLYIATNIDQTGRIDPATDGHVLRRARDLMSSPAAKSGETVHRAASQKWNDRVRVTTQAPEKDLGMALLEHRLVARRLALRMAQDPAVYRDMGYHQSFQLAACGGDEEPAALPD